MKVLVTGATGKVGNALASALLERGDDVRVLVRDPERAAAVLPSGVEVARGDATDPSSLPPAVAGCELVFNAMGLPEQWFPDEGIFDRVNAVGSGDLARAAREAGVRRFIHTSTNDVFHADRGAAFDESEVADYPKGTAYERSKQEAERRVLAQRDGMEVVITNPTAVYGPGPVHQPHARERPLPPRGREEAPRDGPRRHGPGLRGRGRPGPSRRRRHGKDGERYILSDTYVELADLAARSSASPAAAASPRRCRSRSPRHSPPQARASRG